MPKRSALISPWSRPVALSHSHYDHAGGLEALCRINNHLELFLHPDCLASRSNLLSKDHLLGICKAVHQTAGPTDIGDGIRLTGAIPRVTDFEDAGRSVVEDQALFFETLEGVVILVGCAHAGVVNTLHYVGQLNAGKPIHAVIGGMHLIDATKKRIGKTIEAFIQYDLKLISAGHCTGESACEAMAGELGDRFIPLSAGLVFEF